LFDLFLTGHELFQVCIVATGVVGDLCRALEQDILPYCQHIMGWLMINLEGAEINRFVFLFCVSYSPP